MLNMNDLLLLKDALTSYGNSLATIKDTNAKFYTVRRCVYLYNKLNREIDDLTL